MLSQLHFVDHQSGGVPHKCINRPISHLEHIVKSVWEALLQYLGERLLPNARGCCKITVVLSLEELFLMPFVWWRT